MKFGVIIFPGSNCDHDAYWTFSQVFQQPATMLWHESHDLENVDVVIVPGGFADGRNCQVLAGDGECTEVCCRRRPRYGNLQRVPNPDRIGAPPRRAAAQPWFEVHLQAGTDSDGEHGYTFHSSLRKRRSTN